MSMPMRMMTETERRQRGKNRDEHDRIWPPCRQQDVIG